ncbi:hypothetical protein TNCV_3303771 [Trichonephila clavipes]|nr:hypothetical protein TNCV_3303771 [Trichonephila clavipes]
MRTWLQSGFGSSTMRGLSHQVRYECYCDWTTIQKDEVNTFYATLTQHYSKTPLNTGYCNVVTPNGDRHLWWTRHSHVHLAAADKTWRRSRHRNPFFDPRGIEPRRPEDEGEML